MNIPRSSLRMDKCVSSLNYEGIAVIELQFLPQHCAVTDCMLALKCRLNSLNELAVMVSQSATK